VMVRPTGQPAAGLVQPPSMLPSKVSQSSMSSLQRITHRTAVFITSSNGQADGGQSFAVACWQYNVCAAL
jgi:hypothetical protein